jgi:hypothetical protein
MMVRIPVIDEINTDGKFRVVEAQDGYYVVGHGLLCSVDNPQEGEELIRKIKHEANSYNGDQSATT